LENVVINRQGLLCK